MAIPWRHPQEIIELAPPPLRINSCDYCGHTIPLTLRFKRCAICDDAGIATVYCSAKCARRSWRKGGHKDIYGVTDRPTMADDFLIPLTVTRRLRLVGMESPVQQEVTMLLDGTWLQGRSVVDTVGLLVLAWLARVTRIPGTDWREWRVPLDAWASQRPYPFRAPADDMAAFLHRAARQKLPGNDDENNPFNQLLPVWWDPDVHVQSCQKVLLAGECRTSPIWGWWRRVVQQAALGECLDSAWYQLIIFGNSVYGDFSLNARTPRTLLRRCYIAGQPFLRRRFDGEPEGDEPADNGGEPGPHAADGFPVLPSAASADDSPVLPPSTPADESPVLPPTTPADEGELLRADSPALAGPPVLPPIVPADERGEDHLGAVTYSPTIGGPSTAQPSTAKPATTAKPAAARPDTTTARPSTAPSSTGKNPPAFGLSGTSGATTQNDQ